MVITSKIPLKYLLYTALLSNVVKYEEDGVCYGVFVDTQEDVYDYFTDWSHSDSRKCEVEKALADLGDDGLIQFDEDGRIFLGEYRGRKFFTYEQEGSMTEEVLKVYEKHLKEYGSSRSAKDRSRSRYIQDKMDSFIEKGITNLGPSDFTELHSYMYELYTGGEVYIIRNKVEYYQTNNMLKAYDKQTVFALIIEGTLHYDKHRKKGVPTLTNVACAKDDIFRHLTKMGKDEKDYMREESTSSNEF